MRQVDRGKSLGEQALLARGVAVVRGDAGVGALSLDRAVAREDGNSVDPNELTLAEARDALKAKRISARELTQAHLDAMAKARVLNAYIRETPDQALKMADASRLPSCPETSMAKITYIAPDGQEFVVEAAAGTTVMENAVRNDVPGIEAECCGACSCATCHVYVDEEWMDAVGQPEVMEEDMLDFAWHPDPATSRLTCQLKVTDALDGLVVRMPERQI